MPIERPVISVLLAGFTSGCAFAPTEGTWRLTEVTITEDSCVKPDGDTIIDPATVGTTFTLTNNDDGTFTTELPLDQGGSIVSTCTLDGKSYTCAPESESLELVPDGTVTIVQTDGGTFEDADTHRGSTTIDISCAGDGCPDVQDMFEVDFPCRAVIEGVAHPLDEP